MLSGADKLDLTSQFIPYTYQLNAVEEVKSLEYAALFHEQGLGKTKIALDLALQWLASDELDSVLIVAKKGLVKNWEKESKSHTNLSFATLDNRRTRNSSKFNKPYRLYLAHYEAVSGSMKSFSLFLQARRVGVILDEAHYIKNPKGRIAKAFFELAPLFKRRIIMTGTPVANRPYDLWSQIYFLDQGSALGNDFGKFKKLHDIPKDYHQNHNLEYEQELRRIFESIKPFTIRETKESAGLELPQKHLQNLSVPMEELQRGLYTEYKTELKAKVLKEGQLIEDNVENLLKEMMRLVQVASNPSMVDDSYNRLPGKVVALDKLITDIHEDEKAVIWTNFIANADYLAEHLEKWGCLKLHGKMDMGARNSAVERFLGDPSKRLLVATPGAAKEGLTLTVANHAIFFDRSFSLDDWLQAQDRIHRISQERDCWVTHLFAEESIDGWVDELLLCKKRFATLAQGDTLEQDSNLVAIRIDQEIRKIAQEILKI